MTRAYEEIVDLIASGSSPSGVAEFQPSDAARQRVADLIEMQKTSSLSPDEADELSHYLEVEHIMRLAKGRARQHVQ